MKTHKFLLLLLFVLITAKTNAQITIDCTNERVGIGFDATSPLKDIHLDGTMRFEVPTGDYFDISSVTTHGWGLRSNASNKGILGYQYRLYKVDAAYVYGDNIAYSDKNLKNNIQPLYEADNSSESAIVSLTGDFPESIGKHSFQWKWEIYAIPVNSASRCAAWNTTYTSHTFYTVLNEPKAPMTNPWIDILDLACVWASGQTDTVNTAKKVTEGLFELEDTDGDVDYDIAYVGTGYSWGSNKRQFKLSAFLTDIENNGNVLVDCNDMANLFNIYNAALGLNCKTKRIMNPTSLFHTNTIDPIGLGDLDTTLSWNNHHFGWYKYESGIIETEVYDACVKINSTVPVNKSQDDYDDLLINSGNYTQTNIGVSSIIP